MEKMVNCWKAGKYCARLWGAFRAEYKATREEIALLKNQLPEGECGHSVKTLLSENLQQCRPVNSVLTKTGQKQLCKSLKKDDLFGSYLAVDANQANFSRSVCITALKYCAKCIILGIDVEDIRAATYVYIACK